MSPMYAVKITHSSVACTTFCHLSLRRWSLDLKAIKTWCCKGGASNTLSRENSQLSVMHAHATTKPHVISRLKFEEGGRDHCRSQCRADARGCTSRTELQDHCNLVGSAACSSTDAFRRLYQRLSQLMLSIASTSVCWKPRRRAGASSKFST